MKGMKDMKGMKGMKDMKGMKGMKDMKGYSMTAVVNRTQKSRRAYAQRLFEHHQIICCTIRR